MSFTSVTEPQPSLAWQFESSNVDYVSSLSPSYSTVSGALTSLPTFVSGKYNQAIRLAQTAANAGANTYVLWSLAASPISIDTTGITIACWVNWTTLPGSFISMYDSFSNVLGIYMNSTQTYTGRGFSGTQALTNATSNTSTNSTGVWYHVALTYNSTSVILYKNGVGTTPVATGAPGVTITSLRIGSQANNINPTYAGYACADCTIDDLRIYKTALTSIQVNDIYNQQGMPGRGVQTLAYPYDNIGITSSAAGLWSTRRLRSAYAGPVVNVRRNSDNSQLDFIADQFGNLSNVQSAVTIDAWLTSTTGNVTTWYDQFRSNNFTQTTATSQPQIVKNAGKWVVFFNRDNLTGVPTFYSRMTIPNQISGIKTILYGINTLADTFETLLGQSGVDNAGFRMIGGDFFIGAYGNDRNDFLYTGGRDNRGNGFYLTYWYNNNKYGSSLNIVNDSNPLNQWGLVIGSTPGYTSFGFNSLSDGFSNRAFYGYLSEVAMFSDQISQVDAGSLYADQYISRTISSTLTGAPLFNQLSPAATSSAVGAFSLRAVNGVSTRALAVRAQGQFPPAAMTSDGPQTLTGYSFGGSGSYVASASLDDVYIDYGFRAFDNNIGTWWHSNFPIYTSDTGIYNSGDARASITGGIYAGEWLQIKMTTPILLTSYSLVGRPGFETNRSPRKFWILGSNNDGANWSLVDTQTNINTWASPQVFKTFTISNPGTTYFNTFRIVVNEVGNLTTGASGQDSVQIASWNLVGSPPSADFYADERGNLLTAPVVGTTLQNWLGGATGYVTTWYDQSGRGNHMSCSSTGIQPKIDLVNNFIDLKPSAYFDVSAGTTGPVPFQSSKNYTVVFRHGQFNGSGLFCATQNAAGPYGNLVNNFKKGTGSTYTQYWYGNDVNNKGVLATGNRVSYKWDGTNRSLYVNGTLADATPSSGWAQTSSSIQMIGKTNFDATMNGELYGAFMFTSALSDTDRTLLENFL